MGVYLPILNISIILLFLQSSKLHLFYKFGNLLVRRSSILSSNECYLFLIFSTNLHRKEHFNHWSKTMNYPYSSTQKVIFLFWIEGYLLCILKWNKLSKRITVHLPCFILGSSGSSTERQESAESSDVSASLSHPPLRQRPSIVIDSSQLPTVESETPIKAESKSSLHMQSETMCWEGYFRVTVHTIRRWFWDRMYIKLDQDEFPQYLTLYMYII